MGHMSNKFCNRKCAFNYGKENCKMNKDGLFIYSKKITNGNSRTDKH